MNKNLKLNGKVNNLVWQDTKEKVDQEDFSYRYDPETGEIKDDGEQQENDAMADKNPEIAWINNTEFAVRFFIFKIIDKRIEFTGKLYLNAILKALQKMGYHKKLNTNNTFYYIKEQDNIIQEVDIAFMMDDFYSEYFKDLNESLSFAIGDEYATLSSEAQELTYLKQSTQIFNKNFLGHIDIHDKPILRDTRDTTYFCFKNKIVTVTKDGIKAMDYKELKDSCVWKDHMLDFEFEHDEGYMDSHFAKFIQNVSNNETKRKDAFYSAIGYLLNNHNSPSRTQAIICYDEVPSPTGDPNGGTGKGVFCKAIKQLRNTFKLDGKNIRRDDKFKFQGLTDRTQVFWIDDIAHNFPFEMLHSAITDGFTAEKKYQHQFYIPPEKSPKIILCSNMILTQGGTTNIRRQFILEFSDFYSSKIINGSEEPIKDIHHGLFFDNESWGQTEWNRFFSFMIWCAHYYLSKGLKPYTRAGMERSRLIQTTSKTFTEWVSQRDIEPKEEYERNALYKEYCKFSGEDPELFKQRTFTDWMLIFAKTKGWETKTRSSNGKRYNWFEKAKKAS